MTRTESIFRVSEPSTLLDVFRELDKAASAIAAARERLLSLPDLRRSGRLEAALRAVDAAQNDAATADSHIRAEAGAGRA